MLDALLFLLVAWGILFTASTFLLVLVKLVQTSKWFEAQADDDEEGA